MRSGGGRYGNERPIGPHDSAIEGQQHLPTKTGDGHADFSRPGNSFPTRTTRQVFVTPYALVARPDLGAVGTDVLIGPGKLVQA